MSRHGREVVAARTVTPLTADPSVGCFRYATVSDSAEASDMAIHTLLKVVGREVLAHDLVGVGDAGWGHVRREVPVGVVFERRDPKDSCLAVRVAADHCLTVVVGAEGILDDGTSDLVALASAELDCLTFLGGSCAL